MKSRTLYGKIRHQIHNILAFFTPFKGDMSLIAYRYNRDVQGYFQSSRSLMIISFFVFLNYTYFLITHGLNFDYSTTNSDGIYCKYMIPCMLFYSRVKINETMAFSISYVVMTFLVFILSLMRWNSFRKIYVNSKLYDREETKFSQFFFTSWDWSIKTKATYIEKKRRLRDLYKISMSEVEILQKIKSMTTQEKWVRYLFRLLSFFLSILVLCAYFVGIYMAYIIRNLVRDKSNVKTSYKGVDIIIEMIPTILIVAFNFFFPWVFKLLTKIEKWDYQATIENIMTIKYFIAKLFGLATIYFVNIYFNLLGNTWTNLFNKTLATNINENTFGCPGTYSISTSDISARAALTPISKSLYAECREDDVVINILFIAILEFIVRKIVDGLSWSFLYCFSSKRKKGESYKWPFNPGLCAVNNYIFNIELYAIISFFPYIVAITPLILIAEFKFDVFKLKYLRSIPIKFNLQQENGYLIMFLFIFTSLIICIFNTIFYISNFPHNNYAEVIKKINF
jgi:hypothetical protein